MTAMRLHRYPSPSGGIALGKMGVGATMLNGWKNPYVANGLVAMWDGEWNAGQGVHEIGRENLGNLVQDSIFGNLTGRYEKLVTTSDNYIESNIAQWYNAPTNCNYQSYTVSAVMQTFASANNNAGICVGRDSGTNPWDYSAYGYYYWRGLGHLTYYDVNKSYAVANFSNKKFAYSIVVTPTSFEEYQNGVLVHSLEYAKITPQITNIRFGNGSDAYPDHKRLFTGRVYSRALTAAEIAANYTIDKERFNLP